MKVTIKIVSIALLIPFVISGCGQSPSNTSSNMTGMNMNMTNRSSMSTGRTTAANNVLKQAFEDELNGLTVIQSDVKRGDYDGATTLANQLHDEFHAAILPPLTAFKGSTYAEAIHSKYDALQDAIGEKDPAKIYAVVKTNEDNLHTVAKILGVTL